VITSSNVHNNKVTWDKPIKKEILSHKDHTQDDDSNFQMYIQFKSVILLAQKSSYL